MQGPHSIFYVTGGTLAGDAPCYVERRADEELLEALSQGSFCYVLTARQMGKSSLMVHTAARLREGGAKVVVLDLTGVGQNVTSEQWYDGLLCMIGQQLGLEDELEEFWLSHERLGPLQRWLAALRQVVLPSVQSPSTAHADAGAIPGPPSPLVVFIDETDATRSLPFNTDEFFAGIRECYNRRSQDPEFRRLTFCLLGVASPSDLIEDTRMTPFNIGRRIELGDFTDREANRLQIGLEVGELDTPGRPRSEARSLLKRVLYWTGGHPYLTQRLCQALAADREIHTTAGVDRLCEAMFLSRTASEADDNLVFVRERLLRTEADRAALLDLYRQVREHRRVRDDEMNPLCELLKLAGVARVVQGYLWVRNRIYYRVFDREWVLRHMPDAEVRRQRAAYRRGMLRSASVAAVLLTVLGTLAGIAEYQRGRAHERLVRMDVATGTRLVDAGDLLGALPWFAEALRLDHGKPEREEIHRMRIGATLAQCPRLAQVWFHQKEVTSVAFSRDGRFVLTASKDATARVWETETGRPAGPPLQHRGPINHAAFSPDGRRVVTASDDGTGQVWDAANSARIGPPLRHVKRVNDAEFSPDSRSVITGSSDGTARIWDAATGRPLLPPLKQGTSVTRATFSPDGSMVVTIGGDWDRPRDVEARLWDAKTGRTRHVLVPQTPGWHPELYVCFSPDSRRVVIAPWDGGRVFDTVTGRECWSPLPGVTGAVEFSPDGRQILAACADGLARLFDARTGQPAGLPLRHPHNQVLAAIYNPDGRQIATASGEGAVRLWGAHSGEATLPPLPHLSQVKHLAFSPSSRYLATASADGSVRLWDLAVQEVHTRPLGARPFYRGGWEAEASSPDGRWVLRRPTRDTVEVLDARRGRPVAAPLPHFGRAASTNFSSDGHRVTTILEDGTAQVWEVPTGRRSLPPLAPNSRLIRADFSWDGRVLTASEEGIAQIWDGITGEAAGPALRHRGSVDSARLSRDRRYIATASLDRTARIWDAATGEPITPPLRHDFGVFDAEFSADSCRLYTVDGYGFWSWELPRFDRPVEEVGRLAGVLSGLQVDPALGTRPLRAAEFRRAWETLRAKIPSGPVPARPPSPSQSRPSCAEDSRPSATWPARWEAGALRDSGLTLCDGIDGEVQFSERGGRLCASNRVTGLSRANRAFYLYFRAAPPPPPEGSLYLTVEYYDEDSGENLGVSYDSSDERGGYLAGAYTAPEEVAGGLRLGTRTWRRAIFRLKQPRFWRRENMGSDFRLDTNPIWVHRVELSPTKPSDWDALSRHSLVELSKAIASQPGNEELYFRRAETAAQIGAWPVAAGDLAVLAKREPRNLTILSMLAYAQLGMADVRGYRRTCAGLLKRFGSASDALVLNSSAWTCVLAPQSVALPTRPVELARRAVAARRDRALLNTLGVALYRAGRYEEAVRTIEGGMLLGQDPPVAGGSGLETGSAVDFYFLAMAHQRLGHPREARQWLDRAVSRAEESAPRDWPSKLELRLFRREAEALIHGSG